MSTRRGWVFAAMAVLSGGGCAVIAGYDFGKYSETGGAGGAGGRPASATNAASGFVTSSGFGTSSGLTGSSSSSSGVHVTSSSSSSGRPSSSSASSASSSTGVWGTSASASSSAGASSSSSSGVVTLLGGLVGPEAIAVDAQLVYYTTNNPPAGPSTVGWVAKDGSNSGTSVSGVTAAPAVTASVAAFGSPAYAATWTNNEAGMPTGTLYAFSSSANKPLGTVMDSTLGVAASSASVYFTTTGSKVWSLQTGGSPGAFGQWPEIASGPIFADEKGVYWPTTGSHMIESDLGGTAATPLCTVPDPTVHAVAADPGFVYWTDQNGGVYQVAKGGAGVPVVVNPSGAVPAYGIAADPLGKVVYFTQGTQVFRATVSSMGQAPVALPTTGLAVPLVDPRGVAFDGSYVYVADKGTPSKLPPDGRILRFPP